MLRICCRHRMPAKTSATKGQTWENTLQKQDGKKTQHKKTTYAPKKHDRFLTEAESASWNCWDKMGSNQSRASDDHNTRRAVCVFDSFHGWRRQWTCFLAGVQRFKIDQPLITCKGKIFQERDSIYHYLAPNPAHESAHWIIQICQGMFACSCWMGHLPIS